MGKINGEPNIDKAKRLCSETLYQQNIRFYEAVKSSPYFRLERDGARSADETVRPVGEHFGFEGTENVKTVKA